MEVGAAVAAGALLGAALGAVIRRAHRRWRLTVVLERDDDLGGDHPTDR